MRFTFPFCTHEITEKRKTIPATCGHLLIFVRRTFLEFKIQRIKTDEEKEKKNFKGKLVKFNNLHSK